MEDDPHLRNLSRVLAAGRAMAPPPQSPGDGPGLARAIDDYGAGITADQLRAGSAATPPAPGTGLPSDPIGDVLDYLAKDASSDPSADVTQALGDPYAMLHNQVRLDAAGIANTVGPDGRLTVYLAPTAYGYGTVPASPYAPRKPNQIGVVQDYDPYRASAAYLSKVPEAAAALDKFQHSDTPLVLTNDTNDRFEGHPDLRTGTLYWDPTSAMLTTDHTWIVDSNNNLVLVNGRPILNRNDVQNQNSSLEGIQSPALGLMHEIDHAVRYLDDPQGYLIDAKNGVTNGYDFAEEQRVIDGSETRVAQALGEPTRTNHSSYPVLINGQLDPGYQTIRVQDPTWHSPSRDFD